MTDIELNYGKYSPPKTLEKIITLQSELKERGLLKYGDMLGLYFWMEPTSGI